MKATYRLTPSVTSLPVSLNNFRAAAAFVENPTGSALLLRAGGNDIPSLTNADHRVPAGGYLLVPVDGANFGIGLADPSAVTSSATSNLLTTATVTFLSVDEQLPQFGSASFQSLSLADLVPGGVISVTGAATYGPYDIGAWGGAMISMLASSASGMGSMRVDVSANGTTWLALGTWAFWPDSPAVLTIPRIARYFRVVVAHSAIPGDPALSASLTIRATLQEVLNVRYTPSAALFTRAVNSPPSTFVNHIFQTIGMPSVGVGWNYTGNDAVTLIGQVGPTPSGPWRYATLREQKLFGIQSSFSRVITNPDQYVRIRLFGSGAGNMTGTLYLSVPSVDDLATPLDNIFQALGDTGSSTAETTIFRATETAALNSYRREELASFAVGTGAGVYTNTGIDLPSTSLANEEVRITGVYALNVTPSQGIVVLGNAGGVTGPTLFSFTPNANALNGYRIDKGLWFNPANRRIWIYTGSAGSLQGVVMTSVFKIDPYA